jgi:serine/threonine protein kinase
MLPVCRLDGRKYAVKKIKLQPGGGSGSYARILREVATLSRLQHPNVVRYFQVRLEPETSRITLGAPTTIMTLCSVPGLVRQATKSSGIL